jgi:cytochrome c551
MRIQWRYTAMVAIVAAATALAGCGSQSAAPAPTTPAPAAPSTPAPTTPAPATPAPAAGTTTANAEALVKQNCIACHGDTLDGRGAANKNLQKIGAKLSKDQIVAKITNGGGGMTPFKDKLKDTEISAIADWLAAKK